MDEFLHNFIGTGWKFPIEFNTQTSGVEMITGEEDIQNSLDILFTTYVGERVMHPDFGSNLTSFVFAPMNRSTLTYMESLVSDAILFNEARVIVNSVVIEPVASLQGLLHIKVDYTVSATNNRYNYVYPFYLKEATNLQL